MERCESPLLPSYQEDQLGLMLTEDVGDFGSSPLSLSLSFLSSLSPMQFSTASSKTPPNLQFSTDSLDKSYKFNKLNYKLTFDPNNNPSDKLPPLDFLLNKPRPRPLSCPEKINDVKDWESLRVLLPDEFKNFDKKPMYLREKMDDEKEKDESVVLMRKNKVRRRGSSKRFSLQEIQEVGVVCKEIEETLRVFEGGGDYGGSGGYVGGGGGGGGAGALHQINSAIQTLSNELPPKVTSPNLILDVLCPPLYNIFAEGLKDSIETLFGSVNLNVWKVVEGSVGPGSHVLNELILKINSETELMTDGPLKFNAFICGLLNLNSLPLYLTLLRTKEKLIRTHYAKDSFLYNVNTLNKSHFDQMLNNLKSIKNTFQLDIFLETKLLHQRIMKRSWSDEGVGVARSEKLRIPKSKTGWDGGKFTKLKEQWEILSSENKSRIPRWKKGAGELERPATANANWRKK